MHQKGLVHGVSYMTLSVWVHIYETSLAFLSFILETRSMCIVLILSDDEIGEWEGNTKAAKRTEKIQRRAE